MTHEKLGSFCLCPHCGCKFFDLRKVEAICPKCGKKVDKDLTLPQMPRSRPKSKEPKEDLLLSEDELETIDDFDGEFLTDLDGELEDEFAATGGSAEIDELDEDEGEEEEDF
jgi:hypothetical protein